MLKHLARLIEKHPWVVVGIIIFITLGFATLLPSLEMKTDFADFMPEDEIVQASNRINDYFGSSQQITLLYLEKQKSNSIISSEALREQYFLQEKLSEIPEVEYTYGFSSIIDQVCQLEFGKEFKNCTDEEIETIVADILEDNGVNSIKIFSTDDQNEETDYNRCPKLSLGHSIDEIDIKNCYITFDDEKLSFTIEVYDLSSFETKLKSPIPFTNLIEWYVDFDNLIKLDERLNVSYRISAHFEPKNSVWIIGEGLSKNIRNLIENLRNRDLLNTYKKEVYLWIKPFEEAMYFPVQLNSGNFDFNIKKNQIKIDVPRDELGTFGIAPRFGPYELPAKLTNFKAGTRYYQKPFTKLPWARISANTSYFFERLYSIKDKPILSNLTERFLKYYASITWEDFDFLFETIEGTLPFPKTISIKDIDYTWTNCDIVPDEGISNKILFYKPYLFEDLQTSAKAFLSKDFDSSLNVNKCVIIVGSTSSSNYERNLEITEEILETIRNLDNDLEYIEVQATGEGVVGTQINEITTEANQIIVPMIFVIIIAILFISFRRVSYVVLPLIALVVSTIWILGTMVVMGIPFSTMAIAIVPLIMGLGVDYSVHLSHNYRKEIAKGHTSAQAIKISVTEIGTAMFLAMLTTVIAFLSFLSASIPPIRDLGFLLAIGIIYTFITAITLQASARYLIDRKKEKLNKFKKKSSKLNSNMGKLASKILQHQKKIIVILLTVTIVLAFGAINIKTGFDFDSFLPSETQSIEVYNKIQTDFPFASQDQEYILLEGDVATIETIKGIIETHNNLDDDTFIARNADGSVKSTSIYTIITLVVNYNESLIEEFNLNELTYIPSSNSDLKRLYDFLYDNQEFGNLTQDVLHKNEKGRYDAALISIYIDFVTDGNVGDNFEEDQKLLTIELNEDVEEYGDVEAFVTGSTVITYQITKNLTESQILSTIISLFLAGLVLVIVYRKPLLGIITMVPVLISTIWILGTMYYFGYTLNVLTITITALTIGIGVDYAIHATERFRLVADKTGNITTAVCETISHTGGALLIACLTTCLGFGVLVFAPIPPEAQFGLITAITVIFSFITSVLLLPLFLARWAKWSKNRRGYIISPKPPDEKFLEEKCK